MSTIIEALDGIRSALAADGYTLSVVEEPSRVLIRVDAGPDSCADCLVPKDLMLQMVRGRTPLETRELMLSYPGDATAPTES